MLWLKLTNANERGPRSCLGTSIEHNSIAFINIIYIQGNKSFDVVTSTQYQSSKYNRNNTFRPKKLIVLVDDF